MPFVQTRPQMNVFQQMCFRIEMWGGKARSWKVLWKKRKEITGKIRGQTIDQLDILITAATWHWPSHYLSFSTIP